MKLSFQLPHLSIAEFPGITLPPFTLVTGVNGSGKTHLLRAIEAGRVQADIAPSTEHIRFFDWSNLVPNDTGEYQASSVYDQRDHILEWARQAREEERDKILQWKSRYGLSSSYRGSNLSLFRITDDGLRKWITDPEQANQAWSELQNIGTSAIGRMNKHVRNNIPLQEKFKQLQARFGVGAAALSIRDFEDEPFGWGTVDVFQQSFAQLFLTYFEQRRLNLLRRMDQMEGRQPPVPPISEKEFLEKHGEPPWDFVNRVLAEANLDFSIDYPVDHSITKFTPQLRKTSSGADLRFSELSSGERILMSFAFCLYYSLDERQALRRPKLLLFDEIDAPLHPSMSRQMMDTIQNSLVREQGVNVIMTTHSPSTVAVAPEEAVYVMHPESPGLHKVSKRQAIATLTSEIPTLSIDFDGRRQVFVESRYDAERYEKLYRYLAPKLSSERSLAFISVGQKKKAGDFASGCNQVKRMVDELTKCGNDSVFGLVDWDMQNKREGRVIVLSENIRYAIENCLLDPLLVGALVVHTDTSWRSKVGLADGKGFIEFRDLTDQECQRIIDNVERMVLKKGEDQEFGDRQQVFYEGGNTGLVSTEYLRMEGHQLEECVKEALPVLKRFHKSGEIHLKIIDSVILEHKHLVPVELTDAFRQILNFENC
jgi:predicted ATPase